METNVADVRRTRIRSDQRGWWIAIVLLFAIGAGLRVHNAFGYWLNTGYDAPFNWDYIVNLTTSWKLPHPESHWSAARPPLFFYMGGALAREFGPRPAPSIWAIRIVSSAFGLFAIGFSAWIIRRASPLDLRRVAIASGLLLFLPAHIYMSAMLNEEILAATFTTIALGLAILDRRAPLPAVGASRAESRVSWGRLVGIGLAGGFAFMTKLTGSLVVVAIVAAMLLDGWREKTLKRTFLRAAAVASIALVTGGWFYARSLAVYGYLYPHSLKTHKVMLDLPPGERGIADYVRFPLSTFTNPRNDSDDLMHSVWGGTYATLWFDGQRHFMPRAHANVDRIGFYILLLALLPTLAFAFGLRDAIRRVWATPRSADAPMLALLSITLAGYVYFTWKNPWYPTVKGTYLLGLGLPFAYWASERLALWTRAPQWRGVLVWGALCALLISSATAFTWGTPLWTMTPGSNSPGLRGMPLRPKLPPQVPSRQLPPGGWWSPEQGKAKPNQRVK